MVEVLGSDFENIDNRLLSLTLVKERMTNAKISLRKTNARLMYYFKNILVLRGSFRPVTK